MTTGGKTPVGPTPATWAQMLAERLRHGRVIPFLGAGVNLADRKKGESFAKGKNLPTGAELARHLAAGRFGFPKGYPSENLMQVSQWVDVVLAGRAIYDEFREIFLPTIPPTSVHEDLAAIPGILRSKGAGRPHLLVVTTNYDDAMERAFAAAGESYEVMWYMAREGNDDHRRFLRRVPGGEPEPILDPEVSPISTADRNVVLKVHGAVDPDPDFDSYVVTEDDYVDFMASTDLVSLVPRKLVAEMLDAHFLFLGYRLGDWNLRAFLHGLWDKRPDDIQSVAVDREPRPLDDVFWRKRGVTSVTQELRPFVRALRRSVERL